MTPKKSQFIDQQEIRAHLYDHMRFNLMLNRCNRENCAGRIFDCEQSGGWCDICRFHVDDGIDDTDPHQFFVMAEDEPENYEIDQLDMLMCGHELGLIPAGVS